MERFVLLFICFCLVYADIPINSQINEPTKVNKCCLKNEIYINKSCTPVNVTSQWRPMFTSEKEENNVQINYTLVTGAPDCGSSQPWRIFHYPGSNDKLRLLPNGVLRHYYDKSIPSEEEELQEIIIKGKEIFYHDYEPGKYCLDKNFDGFKSEFAWVCAPNNEKDWLSSNEFLMHNVVSPVTHSITIICLLITAVIYFVMPTLRDLTGNIVTTICMCLIVSQTADMIRLLTVFESHISLIITEAICYIALLGAFFWLNSLGYYIWKTFKSRNVFLRITDGKKYCYYSSYAWSCTIILGAMAIFVHFTMDYQDIENFITYEKRRETIGSLGMIIFFVPVAFTVLVDIFFFATTLKTINRMHTYGRIHHKLRHSFRMFLLLLLILTLCWLFFLSSFSKYEGLINSHIVVNSILGPAVLYICIFNQKHAMYLIKKTCCYKNCVCKCCRPEPEIEWGDEMTAMNTNRDYWQ